MASKSAIRSFASLTRPSRRRCACSSPCSIIQTFSTSSSRPQEQYGGQQGERPRWSYTPERMKAPFQVRIKDPDKAWECNEDPAKLDRMYITFLGPAGLTMLNDDLKWLAVTHKSFDQGRRGFNDRLAFLGRRILELQTSLALLNSPTINSMPRPEDAHGREPFQHPALEGLKNIQDNPISNILTPARLASLATSVGISEVTQWKPRYPSDLPASGFDIVMTASLYGVIGAISLHRGGDVANRMAIEKVLKPLGVS